MGTAPVLDDFQFADLKLKWYDFWLKVVAAVIAGVGACWGYQDFMMKTAEYRGRQETARVEEVRLRQQEIEQREREYKVRFYERQASVYFEICDVTAKIALARRQTDAVAENERFKELFVGRLYVVADQPVYDAVLRFNDELRKLRSDKPTPNALLPLARGIAAACRDSLRDAFPNIGTLGPDVGAIGALVPG
jgi:hypothetical protein